MCTELVPFALYNIPESAFLFGQSHLLADMSQREREIVVMLQYMCMTEITSF